MKTCQCKANFHRFLYVRNRLAPLANDGTRSNAELKIILEGSKTGRACMAEYTKVYPGVVEY